MPERQSYDTLQRSGQVKGDKEVRDLLGHSAEPGVRRLQFICKQISIPPVLIDQLLQAPAEAEDLPRYNRGKAGQ